MQYYSRLKEMSYQAIKVYDGNLNAYCVWMFSRVWLFCNLMDYSLPGSSIHVIFQARILEGVIISFSKGSSWPGIEPASYVSPALAGRLITTAPPGKPKCILPGEISESEKASYYMIQSI